jgi:hypothetical protein
MPDTGSVTSQSPQFYYFIQFSYVHTWEKGRTRKLDLAKQYY